VADVDDSYTQSIIDERLKPGAEPKKDMLQIFINNGLNREELLSEVGLQL
jgi:hypothetical protein